MLWFCKTSNWAHIANSTSFNEIWALYWSLNTQTSGDPAHIYPEFPALLEADSRLWTQQRTATQKVPQDCAGRQDFTVSQSKLFHTSTSREQTVGHSWQTNACAQVSPSSPYWLSSCLLCPLHLSLLSQHSFECPTGAQSFSPRAAHWPWSNSPRDGGGSFLHITYHESSGSSGDRWCYSWHFGNKTLGHRESNEMRHPRETLA